MAWFYTAVSTWIETWDPKFWPMDENKGFGASSFLTFSIAFNVALAKWEQFSKSILEIDKTLRSKTEEYVSKHAAAFADSKYHSQLTNAIDRCIKKVDKFPAKTRIWWKRARIVACLTAAWGTYELFFQRSVGVYGIILWIAPAITFSSQLIATFKIWWTVRRVMKDEAERLVEKQEKEESQLEVAVKKALEEAFEKTGSNSKS